MKKENQLMAQSLETNVPTLGEPDLIGMGYT